MIKKKKLDQSSMLLHIKVAKGWIAKPFQAEHFRLKSWLLKIIKKGKIKRSMKRQLAPIPLHTVKEAKLTIKSINL